MTTSPDDPTDGPGAYVDAITELIAAQGWICAGVGSLGSLWKAPDGTSMVAIPNGLAPANWEWSGVIRRVAAGLGVDENDIVVRVVANTSK